MIIIIISLISTGSLLFVTGRGASWPHPRHSLRRRHRCRFHSRFCMMLCNMFAFALRTENSFG